MKKILLMTGILVNLNLVDVSAAQMDTLRDRYTKSLEQIGKISEKVAHKAYRVWAMASWLENKIMIKGFVKEKDDILGEQKKFVKTHTGQMVLLAANYIACGNSVEKCEQAVKDQETYLQKIEGINSKLKTLIQNIKSEYKSQEAEDEDEDEDN